MESNWKTWALIAFIATGALFEGLKRIPQTRSQLADNIESVRANIFEPYSVNTTFRRAKLPRPRIQPALPVAALAKTDSVEASQTPSLPKTPPSVAATDSKEAKKKKKKKDVKLAADEEWEIYQDPTTGKKYRRKRKKAVVAEVAPINSNDQNLSTQDADDDDNIEVALNNAIQTGKVTPAPVFPNKPTLETFEDWKRLLLARPDLKETKRFIAQHQRNLVTDETFYKIIQLMLDDPRIDMKQLGVYALGVTPDVKSFSALAKLLETEKAGPVKTRAEQFLVRYEDFSNLRYLERILRASQVSYATFLATQQLEKSAKRNLSPESRASGTSTANPPPANSKSRYYQRFVGLLEKLVQNPEPTLKQQAQTTLASLQNLLGLPEGQTSDVDPAATAQMDSAQVP